MRLTILILLPAVVMPPLFAVAPESHVRIFRWLEAWDSHGWHRTGTAGDEAGAAWLAREATAIAGPVVASESFAFQLREAISARVEIGGTHINGEALLDAPDTAPEGVRGLATDHIGGGPIAVLSSSTFYGPDFAQIRREGRHAAHIVITEGNAPGLVLLNAPSFRAPFGPPTIQISSLERDRVFAALSRQVECRVVVQTRRTPVQARNIVLTLPGRDRTRPPVVVMTPRSGWWQAASERGGGLVCWLETLRALKAHSPWCDVVLTANTGHELGFIGLEDFVARRPGWEARATWIHYGSNLGAKGCQLMLMSAHDDLRDQAMIHLSTAGKRPDVLAEKNQVPTGETRDIHRAGGRYLTIVGPPHTARWFHHPEDRWPDAVDVDAVARIAEGVANLVVSLTR